MSEGGTVHIDVLGPVRARDAGGADLTPDGTLQRRLLALLVLHRGQVVTTEAAIDALWPTAPPRDPAAALQTHLFRLRKSLPSGVVTSTDDGYRLDPARVEVDAERLAATVASGATDRAALTALEAALARWRGPAYPELADVDDGRVEAARLEELRVLSLERLAEARLAEGATEGLVVDLAALVEEHPLRERPRALLMEALAATGRVAEALRSYDDFRRRLGDELGIDPSPALEAQHRGLLDGSALGGWAIAHRLPLAVSSLVGREDLLDQASALAEGQRVLSLLGPGGVGKTRLAIELGHRLRAARPDRPVVLIELATATTESAVEAVAAALAIEGRPGLGLTERLAEVLADVDAVLLLDNCEHVLEPVAALVECLLAGSPQLSIVATSRERLRVTGEALLPVPPLAFAADDAPAVRLFVERAQAVSPGFVPEPRDHARIVEIVRRLDGLPLAIELAAARLHTLDVSEVAAGLDRRFRLLSSGPRASTRHGSLGAAVSWSVGLLEDSLRRTFCEVSVFSGGFTLADAAAVTTAGADTADALDQLAERSLVLRAPGRRYVLLETLREYGRERLEEDGTAEAAHRRHAEHVVRGIEDAYANLTTPGAEHLLTEIDGALPELRNALSWLLATGDVEMAGRIVVALEDYGFLRLRPDVLAWAERVTEADPDDQSPLAGSVWAVAALAVWMRGDLDALGARVARAVAVVQRSGRPEPAQVATVLGSHALFTGRLADARDHYRRAQQLSPDDAANRIQAMGAEVLALAYAGDPAADEVATALLETVGDRAGPHAAYAWYCAGEADLNGDLDRARERLARAVDLAERTNASIVSGIAGTSSASIELRAGNLSAATEEYRRLLAHWRRAGMWATQWTTLRAVARLLEAAGRPQEAAVLAGAVLATAEGHRIFGDDAAALRDLEGRLRDVLGDEAYATAIARGSVLDGPGAVEHALQSL